MNLINNELKKIGNIDQKGHNSLWGRVYDTSGLSSTLNSEGGGLGAKTGLYQVGDEPNKVILGYTRDAKGKVIKHSEQEHANTLHASTGHGGNTDQFVKIKKTSIRRLTPVECNRLQGFPDDWNEKGIVGGEIIKMSDTQRYRQAGNAVTVPIVKMIAEKIKERIFNEC